MRPLHAMPRVPLAPNNDAFARLPPELSNQFFEDPDFIPQLVDLLLYHVVGDLLLAAALESDPGLADLVVIALNGERLFFASPPLAVNESFVVDGDNILSNGVVHIIDNVLLPSWIFFSLDDQIFFSNADLSTLFSLLNLAEIDSSLPSAVTVVGATNDAFDLLDPAFLACLQTACLN
jgi:uncharacterized surface protein with fasciclin (FAS1) repeats